jgi:hypothetical protein
VRVFEMPQRGAIGRGNRVSQNFLKGLSLIFATC